MNYIFSPNTKTNQNLSLAVMWVAEFTREAAGPVHTFQWKAPTSVKDQAYA